MERISLSAPGGKAIGFLFLFCVVLPPLAAFLALSLSKSPRGGLALWGPLAVGVTTFSVLGPLMLRRGMEHAGAADGLRIKSSFYTVDVSWKDIEPGLRVISLKDYPDQALKIRTNGMAVPGYRSGWYRTAQGSRVFAHLVSDTVLRVPTRSGYDLLLSVDDAQACASYLSSRLPRQ